jgi:hypothetical protein
VAPWPFQSQGPELRLARVPRHTPRRFPERPHAHRRPLDPCPDPVYLHEHMTVPIRGWVVDVDHSPIPHHVSELEIGLACDLVQVQVHKRDEVANHTQVFVHEGVLLPR